MIFALLFFFSFVVGLVAYLISEKWWLGGVLCSVLLIVFSISILNTESLRGLAVYFGVPIVFLGSLFGAYIVQLRRGTELDIDNSIELDTSSKEQSSDTDK